MEYNVQIYLDEILHISSSDFANLLISSPNASGPSVIDISTQLLEYGNPIRFIFYYSSIDGIQLAPRTINQINQIINYLLVDTYNQLPDGMVLNDFDPGNVWRYSLENFAILVNPRYQTYPKETPDRSLAWIIRNVAQESVDLNRKNVSGFITEVTRRFGMTLNGNIDVIIDTLGLLAQWKPITLTEANKYAYYGYLTLGTLKQSFGSVNESQIVIAITRNDANTDYPQIVWVSNIGKYGIDSNLTEAFQTVNINDIKWFAQKPKTVMN